jgi:hypothetical protein
MRVPKLGRTRNLSLRRSNLHGVGLGQDVINVINDPTMPDKGLEILASLSAKLITASRKSKAWEEWSIPVINYNFDKSQKVIDFGNLEASFAARANQTKLFEFTAAVSEIVAIRPVAEDFLQRIATASGEQDINSLVSSVGKEMARRGILFQYDISTDPSKGIPIKSEVMSNQAAFTSLGTQPSRIVGGMDFSIYSAPQLMNLALIERNELKLMMMSEGVDVPSTGLGYMGRVPRRKWSFGIVEWFRGLFGMVSVETVRLKGAAQKAVNGLNLIRDMLGVVKQELVGNRHTLQIVQEKGQGGAIPGRELFAPFMDSLRQAVQGVRSRITELEKIPESEGQKVAGLSRALDLMRGFLGKLEGLQTAMEGRFAQPGGVGLTADGILGDKKITGPIQWIEAKYASIASLIEVVEANAKNKTVVNVERFWDRLTARNVWRFVRKTAFAVGGLVGLGWVVSFAWQARPPIPPGLWDVILDVAYSLGIAYIVAVAVVPLALPLVVSGVSSLTRGIGKMLKPKKKLGERGRRWYEVDGATFTTRDKAQDYAAKHNIPASRITKIE